MKLFPFLIVLLVSCSLAPCYREPYIEFPFEWKAPIDENATLIKSCPSWWELFQDEVLTELIETALVNSPNLEAAYQRVMEARSLAFGQYANLFPQIFLQPTTQNIGSLISSNFGSSLFPTISNLRQHFQQYTFPLSGTYEVDLFGRLRENYNATVFDAEASFYDYESVKLTLTTDVAANYFTLRSIDAQILVYKDTIDSRQAAYDVNKARYEAGLVNFSDVSRALNELLSAKADLVNAEIQRATTENILATLVGFIATEFCLFDAPLRGISPEVAPNLPSELILQRPDVAKVERNIAAANARIGVARTDFFPRFSLNGQIGFQSDDIDHLFNWQSRLWTWGSALSQLVFDGGKARANTNAASSHYWQNFEIYMNTVLVAFQETETALVSQRLKRGVFQDLLGAVDAAYDTRVISQERYLKGLVTYLDVVDAERTLLVDRVRMELARLDTYLTTVQLIKAIGGGFRRQCDYYDPASNSSCTCQ